jgi:hypothetical protein
MRSVRSSFKPWNRDGTFIQRKVNHQSLYDTIVRALEGDQKTGFVVS